jgi:hypothetical protein
MESKAIPTMVKPVGKYVPMPGSARLRIHAASGSYPSSKVEKQLVVKGISASENL